MDDMPDLAGDLTIYLGGGEGGEYRTLIDLVRRKYPDFDAKVRTDSSASLANTIIGEAKNGQSRADVFLSVDAGSLGAVAGAGATSALPETVLDMVPATFRDDADQWVGLAGRARAIPYDSDRLSKSDLPTHIDAFTDASGLTGALGWAPSYGAFQSFVTAMRLLEGEAKTKAWLRGMLDQNVSEYRDEFFVANAVADGELAAGFANHYYALRVRSSRPNAPIELAFTQNDAGALVNVSGAEVIDTTASPDLAANFVHHLLSAEAQEFFATVTFGYPMVEGVAPVAGLPTIEELNPPSLDLTKLADVQPTLDLMREVGVL